MTEALWRVRLLGRVEARQSDLAVTRFATHKTESLLGRLALSAGSTLARDDLAELIWPDVPRKSARDSLKQALACLRRQLEPAGVPFGTVIAADNATVRLTTAGAASDVVDMEQALSDAAKARDSSQRAKHLEAAIELYGGDFMPGHSEDWVLTERDRLSDAYVLALGQLSAVAEERGDTAGALAYARRAARAQPLHHDEQHRLIRLLVLSGDRSGAAEAYDSFARLLRTHVGETPDPSLRELLRTPKDRTLEADPPTEPTAEGPDPPTWLAANHVPAGPAASDGANGDADGVAGTVTFLVTEIDGAAGLWERHGPAFSRVLDARRQRTRQAVEHWHGAVRHEAGASFVLGFPSAADALACAAELQAEWRCEAPAALGEAVGVRMAVHTGDTGHAHGDGAGAVLHRAAKLLDSANPGQIVCSEPTAAVCRTALSDGLSLRSLGLYRLRGSDGAQRIYQLDHPGMQVRTFPPPRAETAVCGSVPMLFTRFFGRSRELTEVENLLRPCSLADLPDVPTDRLVSVTGPGGVGKTRLALEVACHLREAYEGSVWFVPLDGLHEGGDVVSAAADVMRLPRNQRQPLVDLVLLRLAQRPSLLVLDNAEHLLDPMDGGPSGNGSGGLARFVADVLEKAPLLKCLVTSRRSLGLDGEREYSLEPLPTPRTAMPDNGHEPGRLLECESVRLFVDRAQAVRPGFALTPHYAPAVSELCNRLEGLPLAIEIAAARAQVLTPAQMLEQLNNRLDFLVGRRRDMRPRQHSVRAAVDWSFQLLPESLRDRFAAVSVFRGGWTVEGAAAVWDCQQLEALEALEELRECSLVQTYETPEGMRFTMLEMLREFASERLVGDAAVSARDRHLRYYADYTVEQWKRPCDRDPCAFWDRLGTEVDNARAALAWCDSEPTATRVELAIRLLVCMNVYWFGRGDLREGLGYLRRLLDKRVDGVPLKVLVQALASAARTSWQTGDFEAAMHYAEEGVKTSSEIDGEYGMGEALSHLAMAVFAAGDCARARSLCNDALARAEATNIPMLKRSTQILLGEIARHEGKLDEATKHYGEVLEDARARQDRSIEMVCLGNLACVAFRQRDYVRAAELAVLGLSIGEAHGETWHIVHSLPWFAGLAVVAGRYAEAAKLLGAAEILREETGHTVHPGDRGDYDAVLASVRSTLTGGEFADAWQDGRALSCSDAVAAAREIGALWEAGEGLPISPEAATATRG